MNSEKMIDLCFFKNIPVNQIEFENEEYEKIDISESKMNDIIQLVNDNAEKFKAEIIFACRNKINFDYTFGNDEEDNTFFEETLKPYIKSYMSREEYQEKVNKISIDNYNKEMEKIIDYNKLFSDTDIKITVRPDEFVIEISDGGLFADPIDVIFDYTLEVQDILE